MGWVVPATGLCAALSAGISIGKGLRCPQPLAEVALGAVGVFSGEGFWAPSALFSSHEGVVAKGIPFGTRSRCGHSCGSGCTGV